MVDTHLTWFVQDGKSVPCYKDRTLAISLLSIHTRVLDIPLGLVQERRQLKHPIIWANHQDNSPFRQVEAESPWWDVRTSEFAHTQKTYICTSIEVIWTHIFVSNIIQGILMDCKHWPFTLKFEYNKTTIMSHCKKRFGCEAKWESRIGHSLSWTSVSQSVLLDPRHERVTTGSDQLVFRMEQGAGNIVEMATA